MSLRLGGAKQVYTSATVDHMPMMTAAGLMFGARNTASFSMVAPDVDACHTLVLVGCNPLVSNATGITAPRGRLKAIQERGGRIIVIDPVRTATAEQADRHVAVRPGGDAALLAALVNVIFAEGLDRLDRIEQHAAGVDTLRAAVSPFTPEAVSKRTGVAPQTIRELAREIASAPSVGDLRTRRRDDARVRNPHGVADVGTLRGDRQLGPARRGALPAAGGRQSQHPWRPRTRGSHSRRVVGVPGWAGTPRSWENCLSPRWPTRFWPTGRRSAR